MRRGGKRTRRVRRRARRARVPVLSTRRGRTPSKRQRWRPSERSLSRSNLTTTCGAASCACHRWLSLRLEDLVQGVQVEQLSEVARLQEAERFGVVGRRLQRRRGRVLGERDVIERRGDEVGLERLASDLVDAFVGELLRLR